MYTCGERIAAQQLISVCCMLYAEFSPHVDMALDGVEIITNGSGSHHELRKTYLRFDLLKSATVKVCLNLCSHFCGSFACITQMWSVSTDRVAWSVCMLVTTKMAAEMAELIEMLFGGRLVSSSSQSAGTIASYQNDLNDWLISTNQLVGGCCHVGPRKDVLDGGLHWRHLANTVDRYVLQRQCSP